MKLGIILIIVGWVTPMVYGTNIAVIGSGYVGLVAAACYAELGNSVCCVDNDSNKIRSLRQGSIPFFEEGLEELVHTNMNKGRLSFTMDIDTAVSDAEIIVIAVSTPMRENGQADVASVFDVVQSIIPYLNNYRIICIKSTVPLGTADRIQKMIRDHGIIQFDVVSNPEFLKEGVAVADFMHPDRIVIGATSERAFSVMKELYKYFNTTKFVFTTNITAEAIKYASNAFLASKLSFVNDLAHLCEIFKADIGAVTYGMGLDERIGLSFLKPGPGFGGSCLPKDMKALLFQAHERNVELKVIEAAWWVNQKQPFYIIEKLMDFVPDLAEKTIAVLGLAFKAYTDDIRCSPAIPIMSELEKRGAFIKAYDPCAMSTMSKMFPEVEYSETPYAAVENADAVLILTEWPEFEHMDLRKVKEMMRQPIVIDTKNILTTDLLQQLGFYYSNMGYGRVPLNIDGVSGSEV